MATIVTRSGKGSPLTNSEVDANFTNLNTELGTKADASSLSSYQPLDGDLTSIAGLVGTTGLLRKTAANSFSLDTSAYLTTESDPTVPSHVKEITTTKISNWDTAFGWGNHASAGYITGITSGNVTTALGYTPYDATNPAGYITSAGSISGNAATATNISNTGTVTLASATESNSIYATAPSYGADQPTKLLNFDWYSNVFSLGNIRSTSTDSNGFGVYYTATGGSRAELARFLPNGNFGIGTVTAPERLTIAGNIRIGNAGEPNVYNMNIVGRSPAAGTIDWDFKTNDATYGARTPMTISATGSVVANFDVRAPIFYDSNNTGYYVDAASNSALYQLTTGVGINLNGGIALVASGATLANSIGARLTESYGPVWNLGDGATWHHQVINGSMLCGFSALGTNWGSGNIIANGYLRGTLFYDQSDTAYYVDPNSLSNLVTIHATKTAANNTPSIQVRGGYAGYPRIQTYGLDNDPNAWMGLGTDMAGGPYEHSIYFPNGSFGTQGNGRLSIGDYNGTTYNPRLWVYPTYTQINNSTRSPLFYDSDNTGYYVDPNGVTRINKLTAGERSLVGYSTISMSGLDANTWYPVTIPVPVARQTTLRIENGLNSNVPSWSTHPNGFSCYFEWTTNGSGWGVIGISRRITDWREDYTSVQIVGGIAQMTFSSQEVIWLRGGANYYFSADCDVTPTVRTSSYEAYGQTVAPRSTVFNDPWATAVGKMSYGTFQANERVTAATDIRAPIFYDSANTAYYVDPNGTSQVSGANFNFGATGRVYDDGNFHIDGLASPVWINSIGGSTIELNTQTSGYVNIGNSARAPIYYDSANTAYYVDPASTSNLVGLTVANTITGSINGTAAKATDLNQARYVNNDFNTLGTSPQVFRAYTNYIPSGGSYNQPASGGQDFKVLQWGDVEGGTSGNWGGQIVQNFYSDRMWFRRSYATTWQEWREFIHDGNYTSFAMPIGSSATNSVDVRAPIFYDSNNTGYYVDPSNVSFIYGLSTNVGQEATGAANSSTAGLIMRGNYNSNTWAHKFHKFDNGNGVPLYLSATVGEGVWTARQGWGSGLPYISQVFGSFGADSVYSPIFYDSDNTAYFVNPASNSQLNTVSLGAGSKLHLVSLADGNHFLRYAGTGFSGVVTDGPQLAGHQGGELATNMGGDNWSLRWDASGNTFSRASSRAPIFYDNNNTAYYVDGNFTSRLNNLSLDTIAVTSGITGLTSAPITTQYANAGTTNTWYPMTYQRAQHSGGYVTHLNTGLYKDVGAWGSGATGWYAAIGGSDASPTQAWYLTYDGLIQNSLGYVSTGGSFRAPVYYDSNNTGYYVSPDSESVFNTLTLFGELNLSAGTTYVDHSGTIVFRNQNNYVNSATLTTGGDFTASGNVTAYSDVRIKDNIETIPNALDKLDLIRGVTYTRTDRDDKERRYAGVIAQEIEKVLPEAIFENEEYKSVDYNATIGLLIQAVKELRDEVEMLRK